MFVFRRSHGWLHTWLLPRVSAPDLPDTRDHVGHKPTGTTAPCLWRVLRSFDIPESDLGSPRMIMEPGILARILISAHRVAFHDRPGHAPFRALRGRVADLERG